MCFAKYCKAELEGDGDQEHFKPVGLFLRTKRYTNWEFQLGKPTIFVQLKKLTFTAPISPAITARVAMMNRVLMILKMTETNVELRQLPFSSPYNNNITHHTAT